MTPLIADRFRLQAPIGDGSFAEIWKAVDTVVGDHVALKVFRPGPPGDKPFPWQTIRNEVRAGLRMGPHPNVVRTWAVIETRYFRAEQTPCILMDYVEGPNLAEWLDRQPPPGPRTIDLRLTVIRQILEALVHVHDSGITHNDIGFGNVIVSCDPPVRAHLTDFGAAQTGDPAPEEIVPVNDACSLRPLNPPPYGTVSLRDGRRRDVYSLATVCYLALSGRHPLSDAWQTMQKARWQGEDNPHVTLPRRRLIDLASWMIHDRRLVRLSDALLRCVAANPDERPDGARTFIGQWDEAMACMI